MDDAHDGPYAREPQVEDLARICRALKPLVHGVTLLPRHAPSCKGAKVLPISQEGQLRSAWLVAAVFRRAPLHLRRSQKDPTYCKYALVTYCSTMRCVLKNDPFSAMAWRMTSMNGSRR